MEDLKNDIRTMADIRLLVDTFYGEVQKNPVIDPIFIGVIRDDWSSHLDKMYRFWETVVLGDHTYNGSPFRPHARLPLEQRHFDAWLTLWHQTVDMLFAGEKAELAKWRADKMAEMFLSKIIYYANNPGKQIL